MGRDNDAYSEEGPMHRVELNAFYMDVREVTVGKFKRFVEESGYAYNSFDGFDDWLPTDYHPMIFADWNDAAAYCEWAGKRLPAEAEWEYAARGGLRGKLYSWGDDVSIARKYANYRSTGGKDKWDDIAPVGSLMSNGYGLYDITVNAWEWCADWHYWDYYFSSPLKNPKGPERYAVCQNEILSPMLAIGN